MIAYLLLRAGRVTPRPTAVELVGHVEHRRPEPRVDKHDSRLERVQMDGAEPNATAQRRPEVARQWRQRGRRVESTEAVHPHGAQRRLGVGGETEEPLEVHCDPLRERESASPCSHGPSCSDGVIGCSARAHGGSGGSGGDGGGALGGALLSQLCDLRHRSCSLT